MERLLNSFICIVIPWTYAWFTSLNYIQRGFFGRIQGPLGQTLFYSALSLVLILTFVYAKGKLDQGLGRKIGYFSAMQMPVVIALVVIAIKVWLDPNNVPTFWGLIFFTGRFNVPFSIYLLILTHDAKKD